jgi:DNA recombination protein Rad52
MNFTDSEELPAYPKVESQDDLDELAEKLARIPGPEYISSRPGARGTKIYYLSGDKSSSLANDIFGPNNWGCSVKSVTVDELDVTPNSIRVSVTAMVKVTCLIPNKYGQFAFHEDLGTGFAQANIRSGVDVAKVKADTVDHAKKSAVTDARKRALRQFGNAVGLFLTDQQAVKMAVSQAPEVATYAMHRRSASMSRMSTPAPSIPLGDGRQVYSRMNAQSPPKRRATEMEGQRQLSQMQQRTMDVDQKNLAEIVENEWDEFD